MGVRQSVSAMPCLYLMCGVPFAGKSTVARGLARSFNLPLVSMDAINGERGLGIGGAAITPAQWTETYAETYRRLDALSAKGASVVYDAANFTRHERAQVREIAWRHHAVTCVIYVPINPDEARRRLHANRVRGERNDVRDEDFENVVRSFEPPDGEDDVIRYDPALPLVVWLRETFLPDSSVTH